MSAPDCDRYFYQTGDVLQKAKQADQACDYANAVLFYQEVLKLVREVRVHDRLKRRTKWCDELQPNVERRIAELSKVVPANPPVLAYPKVAEVKAYAPPKSMPAHAPEPMVRQHPQRPAQAPPPARPQSDDAVPSMEGAIMREKPTITFKDVAGLAAAKQALNEAVIVPIKLPHLFDEKTRPWKGILLYGPPGTGKSYLAKALAGEANGMTFLAVSVADLVSKWVGESEKLIRSLFETARQNRPAIVFIDEIDSMVSKREDSGSSEASSRMKTEFLVQMDGVNVDNRGVLVVAATNLPWAIDMAVRRRFEKRIYVPLPDAEARKSLLVHSLKGATCKIGPKTINKIVELTEGFSGADLAILIRDALMEGMREILAAQYFKRGKAVDKDGNERDDLWVVAKRDDPGAVHKTWEQLNPDEIGKPITRAHHFSAVFSKVKPSVAKSDLIKYEKWTKEFGEEGR